MNLFFKENIKLRKILYVIDIIITIIFANISFKTKTPLQSVSSTLIIFSFLIVISNALINYRDNNKLTSLLDLLYNQCNPSLFLDSLDSAIDFSIISNKVKSLVLSHKANALCYNGEFKESYKILDQINDIASSKEDKAIILGNRISYKLLEEDYTNLDDDILSLQKYINLNKGKSKKKSILTINSVVQKRLQLKISQNEKLNSSEVNSLWEITNNGNNNLNLETLRYYSALFLFEEKDLKGAIEQLKKINFKYNNNIIEKRANDLYHSLTKNGSKFFKGG